MSNSNATYLSRYEYERNVDFSKATKATRNGGQMDTLLYDLLTTISPHKREYDISKIIQNYVTKNVKQFKIIPDKEVGNLIIQVGKSNVMFSSHMDTVQRTARKTNDLYITEDNYVYAAYPKQKRTYLDNKKEAIEQFEMEKEAEEIGMDFENYVMHNGNLYGSDDDFDGWVKTGLKYKYKDTVIPSGTILGADDKLGCYIMCRMMKEGISGLYVFHVGEEEGGVGSTHLSENRVELFKTIDYCVAFDRKGYNDVIYSQSGGQCCSNQFASAICDEMNILLPPKEQARPSPNGSFTDSANYTHLIPECTNLPVGYFDQHTSSEYFDLEWLERYAIPAYLGIHWTDLPVKRDPQKKLYGSNYGTYGRNYGYGRGYGSWQRDNDLSWQRDTFLESEEDEIVSSSPSFINRVNTVKTQRNTHQSTLDKISHQLTQLEEFDPSIGFNKEENRGQRIKRVLYSILSSNLTLEQIAELVVDTHENADCDSVYNW